jgi:hypothetical protein
MGLLVQAFGVEEEDSCARRPLFLQAAGRLNQLLELFSASPKYTFYLDLKECEFRCNHRSQNLYPLVLKFIRKHPLF